jgi:hypothetical protein
VVPVTASPRDESISLTVISPSTVSSTDAPKGFAPYQPYAKTRLLVDRIMERYELLRDQDALPAGPRTIGYRLEETHRGEYGKADFPNIDRVIKRLNQSGALPFEWVADASGLMHEADGWDSPVEFLRDAHELFGRDRRDGQPVVPEVACEARGTLGLILRLGQDRGVTVYSGGGSSGPGFARKVASRALRRAVEHGQDTLILGLGDFDQAGIKSIMRPHIEHVSAFLYGTAGNTQVLGYRGKTMADTGCEVRFRHLGLTPQMALERAETADLSQADCDGIAAYAASGTGLWDRDLSLLDGVAKFELEALDPAELRALLVDALDGVLDQGELDRVADEEDTQRDGLADRLAALAGEMEDEL